jgi:hypothetical protein
VLGIVTLRARYDPLGRRSALMAADRVEAQIAHAAGDHQNGRDLAFRALRTAIELELPLEIGRVRLVAARCLCAGGTRHAAERFVGEALRAFREIGAEAYVGQAVKLARELGLTTGRPDYGLSHNDRLVLRRRLDRVPYRTIAEELHWTTRSVENRMRLIRNGKLQIQSVEDPESVCEAALSDGV